MPDTGGTGDLPLVSIVTPSLGQGQFIEETIRSVLDQDYPYLEHIVVDGGSTDGTLDVLRRYAHLRWVSEPDRGQADAVNKGFRMARGTIFGWLNADDLYLPNAVSTAVAALRETGAGFVHGGWRQIGEHGETIRDHIAPVPFDLRAQLNDRNAVCQPGSFFTREAFEGVGGLDASYRYAMDYELWLKLGARFPVTHVDAALGTYRLHPASKTVAETSGFWAETVRASRAHGGRRLSPIYVDWYLPRARPWLYRFVRVYRLLSAGDMRGIGGRLSVHAHGTVNAILPPRARQTLRIELDTLRGRRSVYAARVAARRVPARLIAGSVDGFGAVIGTFERADGDAVPLYASYRGQIKHWQFNWWPVRVLSGLARRVALPADAAATLADVMNAPTLPLPPTDLALVAAGLVERFPEHLVVTGSDAVLAVPRVELISDPKDFAALVRRYEALASSVRDGVRPYGLELERARVLDVGTGSGRLAFALAGLGAAEVVGVDLDPEGSVPSLERQPVRELLAGTGRVRLEAADVSRLEGFDDGAFDLVCSMTAIEHFADLPATLMELRRVLRPGGLMYHGVDPWYGKGGGHSLCTLDFPWGHLRVGPQEFERYVAELRRHEQVAALDFYRNSFQVPRRTLAESRAAFEDAGFDVLRWVELPLPVRDPHYRLADGAVLRDCRRNYPTVTRRDLLTFAYGVVARRPSQ